LHILVQPDGKLLVIGGTSDAPDAGTGIVLRLQTTGALDPTFGSNGVVRLALAGSGGLRQFTSLGDGALADGRLLVSGSVSDTTSRGLVARILLDALPDPLPGGPG